MFAELPDVSVSSTPLHNYVMGSESCWTKIDFIPKIPGKSSSTCIETDSFSQAENNLDVSSLSPSEQIKFVRETLRLNMSQIAELLNVTRPTAYAWLDGRESDRGETAGKIMRLAVEVKKIKDMDIPRIDLLIKRPIFGEKSTLDLLRECKDITGELYSLKKIGDKEEATRRNSMIPQSEKNISRMNEAADEISTPIYFEEHFDS
jgi:DNA-binding transcriptional regulator YiaG